MQTTNGYLSIASDGNDVILKATELTGEVESGSRTATVLLSLDNVQAAIEELSAIRDARRALTCNCLA